MARENIANISGAYQQRWPYDALEAAA